METKKDIDVIVVGAGPSGISCAITIAREGNNVLVIERAQEFGTKNMYGGAIYFDSIKELLPDKYTEIPYENNITKHNYLLLNKNNSILISYDKPDKKNSATITRYNFDTFLANCAKEEGVYFANNTLVVDLIKKDGKIIGVKTENEEIYSKIVVVAEGFNSILAEKSGLKKKTKPKDAILAVKETIKLPNNVIAERFNLENNKGAEYQIFGGLEENNPPFAMGFLYTYKNFITLGLGISMESLKCGKIKPHEYLEILKNNKYIKKLIKDGETVEFSAHSIPEGGYNNLPKLYDNGILLVGDAAGLVDAIHFEGTNLAIKSGILAGRACNFAIKNKDYSKKYLSYYKKELFKSFVIRDLKTYRNAISVLFKRRKSIFSYYPKKMGEFFELWTSANNKEKKLGYRKFIFSLIFKRNPLETMKDVISFVKCAIEAVI